MGTEYLMIILMWCGQPTAYYAPWTKDIHVNEVRDCRMKAIQCVRNLHNFDTDMVIDKCLEPQK